MRIGPRLVKRFIGCIELVLVVVLASATPAMAVMTLRVSDTPHNLSTGGGGNFYSNDESQICVFCHTPHNATASKPLWNNLSGNMDFTIYSSATMETDVMAAIAAAGGLPVGSTSRLCLSCHEGTTALNTLANPGSAGADPTMIGWASFAEAFAIYGPGVGPRLSNDLSNMHPIGFDYTLASTDPDIKVWTIPDALGVKFVDGGSGEKFLECITCHEPHVDGDWNSSGENVGDFPGDTAYRKFMRIPNTSSALCLACHDK